MDEGFSNARLTRSTFHKLAQPTLGDHGRLITTSYKKNFKGKVEGDDNNL